MKVYIVEGGVGKHVMFTALLPILSEKEKIIIMSSYPDIFEGNPHVLRSLGRNSQYQWDDLILKEDTELNFYEPYYNLDYIQGKIHLVEAWCEGYGIEYDKEMKPELYLNSISRREVKEFKENTKKYMLVQFSGGQSPMNVRDEPYMNFGAIKNYPRELAQKVVDLIHMKDPDMQIINFCIPNEGMNLENVLTFQTPYLMYAALLEQSEGFIGIDSSLMHFAGALNIRGVTLWGATNPNGLGYGIHTKLTNKCKLNTPHCNKPYNRELGDYMGNGERWKCPDPICIEVNPEKVVEEFFKLKKEI
jgi:hypothetical protein